MAVTKKEHRKKLLLYWVLVIGSLLGTPLFLSLLWSRIIPDSIIAFRSGYVNEQKQFLKSAFQQNPKLMNIRGETGSSSILIQFTDSLGRFFQLSPYIEKGDYLSAVQERVVAREKKKGVAVTSEAHMGESRRVGFSNETTLHLQREGDFLIQMISPKGLNAPPVDVLVALDIFHYRDDIPTWQISLKRKKVTLFLVIIVLVCVLWVLLIFIGGKRVARIVPAKGTNVIAADLLRDRIAALATFDVPYSVDLSNENWCRVLWIFGKSNIRQSKQGPKNMEYTLVLTLHPRSNTVSVCEKKRWILNDSLQRGGLYFSLGIDLFSYGYEGMWHLDIKDGALIPTGRDIEECAEELTSPLKKLIVESGWTWQPALFG